MIEVAGLTKHFRVHKRPPGMWASLRGLMRREYELVKAVDGVTFHVEAGEVVGFLGPNGAGKTTTLKCLAGLLYPDAGSISVSGFQPHQRQRPFLQQITFVMGQRNQLFWDLPAMESFRANREIYQIPSDAFDQTLDELVDLLAIGPYLSKPVRNLSLGERMRCELAGSLLHRPSVLFLDEPTLGLDVTAQAAVRSFVGEYSREHAATVLLTSHYMTDITALAKRVLVIDHGRMRFDGELSALVADRSPYRRINATFATPVEEAALSAFGTVIRRDELTAMLQVDRDQTTEIAARMLTRLPVSDIAIEDPPVEEVIQRIFSDNGSNG